MNAEQKLAEAIAVFGQWTKINKADREREMQNCIDAYLKRKGRNLSASKANELRARIRIAYETTQVLEQMKTEATMREITKGAS